MIAYRFRAARMWIIIPSYTVMGLCLFTTALVSVLMTRGTMRHAERTVIIEREKVITTQEWPAWDALMPLRPVYQTDYLDGWHRMYYDWAQQQPPSLRPIDKKWLPD